MRELIRGIVPRVSPSYNYYAMMKELKEIGNNLNQIAHVANETEEIDREGYRKMCLYLLQKIDEINRAVTAPEELRLSFGNG